MQNSEHKEYKDKIRQLKEDLSLVHTKTLHQIHRILNTAQTGGVISQEQLDYLQNEVNKL